MINIDELEIKSLCDNYGYKYRIYNNTVFINTNFDNWVIEVGDDGLLLKHQNKKRNKSKKNHYHTQRKFRDFPYLIRSIHTHKPVNTSYNYMFRMKELLESVN